MTTTIPRIFEPDALQREHCHDTGEAAPFPVGTVVGSWDATGYHHDQIVIAHPTLIEFLGGYCVAYRDALGHWGLHPIERIASEPTCPDMYGPRIEHAVARVLARAKKLGIDCQHEAGRGVS